MAYILLQIPIYQQMCHNIHGTTVTSISVQNICLHTTARNTTRCLQFIQKWL